MFLELVSFFLLWLKMKKFHIFQSIQKVSKLLEIRFDPFKL